MPFRSNRSGRSERRVRSPAGRALGRCSRLTPTPSRVRVTWLVGGLIVIENVFNYPGLGRLLLFAIDRRDLPLIQGIAMLIVLTVVFANFAADLLYAVLNPRIRFE